MLANDTMTVMSKTPDTFQPRPNFFIAGVPKAGTTSLHEYLKQHPQIFMPDYKEPNYFVHGNGLEKWEDYLSLFKDAGGKKAVGESSAAYSYCEESPGWIKSVLGDVKIIIILRNPARRAFSLYGWMVREGYEDAPTFAEALEREPVRMHDAVFRAQCPQFSPDYLYFTTGLYFEQVKRYIETFGRERIKIYLFEEFIKQPVTICQDVFRFLEVDDNFTPKMELHNEGRIPKSIALQFRLRQELARRRKFIPHAWRIKLVKHLMERNVRRGSKPQPDKQLMESLANRYRQNIQQLEMLLGRNFSAWIKSDKL
jgi:sulfotransferase family protein